MTQKLSRHCMILAAALSLGGTFASSVSAQPVSTRPVGAMTYTLPATTAATVTQFSVVLSNPSVFTGAIASVGTNVINLAGTPLTGLSLATVGSPYFVRVTSGNQVGRVLLVTANTSSSITVDTTDNSTQTTDLNLAGFEVAPADKIEVIIGDTIASFFGDGTAGNPLLIVGNTSAFTADAVGILNKTTSKLDGYFFSTTLGFWRSSTTTVNQNNLVLYPETSFSLTRRAGRPASTFTVTGDVPTVAQKLKTVGSAKTIFTTTGFPAPVALSGLNLTNWTKNNSVFSADTVGIYNPITSKSDVYFQRTTDSTWRKQGDANTDQSGIIIPAGSSITILKRAAVSGSTSFISAQLPYTL